jgi:hypothetical protein
MNASALRCLLAAAAISVAPWAWAEPLAESCQLPGSDVETLVNRSALLAEYERLPHSCLQEIFRACTLASNEGLLDFSSAAVCSFGYEAWLKQGFGGNFRALLAWWRAQEAGAPQ